MVSWVPFSPSSCSTRGRPFPVGAFTTGLNPGEFLGAVKCFSSAKTGPSYLVGSVRRHREGLVCSVNNQGRAEHHHEFWTLVAGEELEWRDCEDTDTLDTLPNKVNIAGSDWRQGAIGLFEDMVGTVNRCQVRLSSLEVAIIPVQCMYAVSREDSAPFQLSEKIKILTYRCPPSLKSLCRKTVRKTTGRKKSSGPERKLSARLEDAKMPELIKYLDFRE